MHFDNPEKFEEFLAPVGGDVFIRPVSGKSFNCEISMTKLDTVGLFLVSANSFRVVKEPQNEFYGLTVPLSSPVFVSEGGSKQEYTTSTPHLLTLEKDFDAEIKRNAHFLVCNFFTDPTHEYSYKVLQSDSQKKTSPENEISFYTQTGSKLLRSVARAWSTVNKTPSLNELAIAEIEDNLLSRFALLLSHDEINTYKKDDPCYLNRAESYICDNLSSAITRDRLAEISGRSIRSLSRAFMKKHGIGPMAFIKQRRLDAAYFDLLSAELGSTTVTRVASNYGFTHTGKFAIEYAKTFGETPSTTLSRK